MFTTPTQGRVSQEWARVELLTRHYYQCKVVNTNIMHILNVYEFLFHKIQS